MKVFLATVAIVAAGLSPIPVQAMDGVALGVEVTDIASARGFVMIAVYDNGKDFPARPYDAGMAAIAEGTAYRPFNLPPGEYAVLAFQDENSNGKLDRHWYRLPKEPLVISGERSRWPRWNKAKFQLEQPTELILSMKKD